MSVELDGQELTPEVAVGLLASLRWECDSQIVNHFGEHVWLGPCLNSEGERIGITDCCFVADPCQRHGGRADWTPDDGPFDGVTGRGILTGGG